MVDPRLEGVEIVAAAFWKKLSGWYLRLTNVMWCERGWFTPAYMVQWILAVKVQTDRTKEIDK